METFEIAYKNSPEYRIAGLEASFTPGITTSEELYDGFRDIASHTKHAKNLIAAIKPVESFEDWVIQTRARAKLEKYYKYHPYHAYRGPADEAIDKAMQYNHESFDQAVGEREFPVYVGHGQIFNHLDLYSSRQELKELSQRHVTKILFTEHYTDRLRRADSLDRFRHKLTIATDAGLLERIFDTNLKVDGLQPRTYVNRLTHQTHLFMRKNPDQAEATLEFWEERVAGLSEAEFLDYQLFPTRPLGIRPDRENSYAVEIPETGDQLKFKHPYFTQQIAERKRKTDITKLADSLSYLSHGSLENSGLLPGALEQLEDADYDVPRLGKDRLVTTSVEIFLNFLNHMAQESDLAAKLKTLCENQRAKQGLSFATFIKLANALTPKVESVINNPSPDIDAIEEIDDEPIGLDLLDDTSIKDLPVAFDRLSLLIRDEAAIEDADTSEAVERITSSISLVAGAAVEQKLEQRVLTLADLIVRYPKASPEDIRNLSEELQSSRSEASVHAVYRDLRRIHKNRAHFAKWVPGKGLLS